MGARCQHARRALSRQLQNLRRAAVHCAVRARRSGQSPARRAPNRAAWTELKWAHASGVYVAAELKHQGRIIANDVGDESTNPVTLLGARIGVQQQWGKARWSAFLRGDNLSGKTYAGTVIVNEANRRYFEPVAGGCWLAGVNLSLGW